MKAIKLLMRRPLKTILGIVLVALAVAILCVCAGQSLATRATAESLNNRFTTIAIPAGRQITDDMLIQASVALPDDVRSWLDETAATYPDIVKGIVKQGILSAYVPGVNVLNYTQGKYISDEFTSGNYVFHSFEPTPYGTPYSCAMFVIELEEVGEPVEITEEFTVEKELEVSDFSSYTEYQEYLKNAKKQYVTLGYTLKISGTITEVVSLQEGFRNPTGMIARLSMTVPSLEQIEKLNLIPGERYLVYGTDYYDEDWAFRELLAHEDNQNRVVIDAFDMTKLKVLTEEELEKYDNYSSYNMPFASYGGLLLTQTEYERVNAVTMTLKVPVSQLQYEDVRDEVGNLLELKEITYISYTDMSGETVAMNRDEYAQLYQIPTITRINGSVDEFMKTGEGALWSKAMNRDNINNSAFAIIGVEKLSYMVDFARQNAQIVEGRDFTKDEIAEGARVCVIHEMLGAANNLNVGDTITMNFYQTDAALPFQSNRVNVKGVLNPTASLYFDTTPFTESTEYTIVGFYRTNYLWCDVSENEYGFSPNTIFIPKTSVETDMEYVRSVMYTTPVIYNGQLEAFRELVEKAGYSDRFIYYDQGYSAIAVNFYNYEELATQMLAIGISVYAVILLLFLLFYPGTQGKTLTVMESLGVPIGKRFGYIMRSTIVIVFPASIIGGSVGVLLWKYVVGALQASAEAIVALQMEMSVLFLIAVSQFVVAILLTAIISGVMIVPKGLAARRFK